MSARTVFQATLEAAENGEKVQEIEYCLFVKLDNLEQLQQADSKELQEQWEMYKDCGDRGFATARIRAIDDRRWVLCTKLKVPNVMGKEEVELPATKAMFEHFRYLGSTGLRKTRYVFPIPDSDLKWEVDVFEDVEGNVVSDWVKLDLEVPAPLESLPELPVTYTESIFNQPAQRTQEETDFVRNLFDKVYNLATKTTE